MKTTTTCWIGLGVLVLLLPLGLILPACFKAGVAWGEWGPDEIGKIAGYVPKGLARLGEFWKAPMPDYAPPGWQDKGLTRLSLAYILSGVAGAALIAGAVWLLGRLLARKDK